MKATLLLLLLLGGAALSAEEKKPDDKGRKPVNLTEEALKIHREALVIDGHNDLPWQLREKADLSFRKLDISRPQKSLHTDIPRLRKGGVGAQFWVGLRPGRDAQERHRRPRRRSNRSTSSIAWSRAIPTPSRWPTRPTTSCASARRARSPR